MKIKVILENELNRNSVLVETNGQVKAVNIPPKPSGFGSSVNGAELLAAASAICYCNDVYREAAKRHLKIEKVTV